MRVALKFILAMLVILIMIRSIEGVLTVRRETYRLDKDIQRDAALLGRILEDSIRTVWLESGQERALSLIEGFNLEHHPVQISWVPNDEGNDLPPFLDAEDEKELRSGNVVTLRRYHEERGEVRYSFIPLDVSDANGFIQLAERLEGRSRYVRHALVREVFAGSIAILLSGGSMLLLGLLVLGKPLSRLRERINRIGEGDLTSRIMLAGRDELSTLASGLNDMCENLSAAKKRELAEAEKRLEALEQMRHMERLTTIGRLASGVAHELGTPLNVIVGRAEMIADGTIQTKSDKTKDVAKTIKSQADRMTYIIQRLLDFSRQRPPRRVLVNGADVVRQAIELVNCLGYKTKIQIETPSNTSSLLTRIDPVQIQQVMTNLIENALQAMPDGGDVIVRLTSTVANPSHKVDAQPRNCLQISVKDEGIGITRENVQNVFDPFFTTKNVGSGTGLGLSITYGIVREHGGWIDVTSEVGKGSCFMVYIPKEGI